MTKSQYIKYKYLFLIFCLCVVVFTIFNVPQKELFAQSPLGGDIPLRGGASSIAGLNSIVTRDPISGEIQWKQTVNDWAYYLWNKDWNKLLEENKEMGSKALNSAIQNALKTIAYDTATYIGSG